MSDRTSRNHNEGRAAAIGQAEFDLGPLEAFIAREDLRGAAVQVPDDAMSPVLFQGDVVRVEKREPEEDEVICVQVGGAHVFGYRTSDGLEQENGVRIPAARIEHIVGVATAVIDRIVRRKEPRP